MSNAMAKIKVPVMVGRKCGALTYFRVLVRESLACTVEVAPRSKIAICRIGDASLYPKHG